MDAQAPMESTRAPRGGREASGEGAWERSKRYLYQRLFSSWAGMAAGDWIRLAAANGGVSPGYWPRAAFVTLCAAGATAQGALERALFAERVEKAAPLPPLFVLGHWRSGTTHLHKLLSLDEQFAPPTMFDCLFPHGMLTGGPIRYFLKAFLPKDRIVDGARLGVDEPFEDEFALAILTGLSPYFSWTFPRRRERHDPRLTLDDVDEADCWKSGLRWFASKLTLKYGRPLVLKSPPHTARIRHILDVFPEARFVHIHRHPCEVFASTRRLIRFGVDGLRLQTSTDDVDEQIVSRYRTMHERFDRDLPAVARGRYVEVRFSDLEVNPIGELERIYEGLSLPGWGAASPLVQKWLESKPALTRVAHPSPEESLRGTLRREWGAWFDRWGYDP